MPPMGRLISLGILTALIVALGITFYQVVAPFLLPLFLAAVTAMLCRPLYLGLVRRTNERWRLAAGLTTLLILVAVLLPLVAGTLVGARELLQLAHRTIGNAEWRDKVSELPETPWVREAARQVGPLLWADDPAPVSPPEDETAEARSAREAAEAERVRKRVETNLRATLVYVGQKTLGVVGAVPAVALGVLGQAVSVIVAVFVFTIALYYFLCDGPALLRGAEGLIPIRLDHQRELFARFDTVVRAVVLSTFLAALAQGVLTTAALAVAGFDHLFVLFLLSCLSAMIPMAGTWLVWAPCAGYLAYGGHWPAAVLLTAWGLVVVGTVDNVVRTYVLNSDAKLHPLLALISVLGGLQVLGLWGVFVGPIVAACLDALMRIFNSELKAFSAERAGPAMTDRPDDGAVVTDTDHVAPGTVAVARTVQKPVAVVSAGKGGRRKR